MQFQVTVLDVTPPDFSLNTPQTKSTASNNCYYTAVGSEFDPFAITDNCQLDYFYVNNNYNNYKSLAYEQFPVGTTQVVWTVRDLSGNETQKTISITVNDDTDPVINCPASSYTRVVDYQEDYYTVGSGEFMPVVSDNCAVTSYLNDFNNTGTLNGVQLTIGTHNITWTALDAAGNEDQCTVTVVIVENLYPAITCPGDRSRSNTTGDCSYTVTDPANFNASSTTPGATLSYTTSPALSTQPNYPTSLEDAKFPVGTTLVTWTATHVIDGTTYTNSCSYYVFVTDDEDPVITPQANVTVNSNAGCWANNVDLGTPVRTDNCGVETYWNNAPSTYPIGTTTVTWWIRDIYDNTSSATQTVTVVDDDAPSYICTDRCRQVDDPLQTYYTVNGHEFDPWDASDCTGGGITQIHNIQTTDPNALPYAPSASTLSGAKIPS